MMRDARGAPGRVRVVVSVLVLILVAVGLAKLQPLAKELTPGEERGTASTATLLTPDSSLAADGFVGRVIDREGVGQFRPRNQERWRIAAEGTRLAPGDWVKTGSRGAHALALQLANGTRLLLGPTGLLEISDVETLELTRGELEITTPEGVTLQLRRPGTPGISVSGRRIMRADRDSLRLLDEEPRWLSGYRSDASTEAMGSLLANVDGRNLPLTMGYHKVSVDIRDQIARTVVEESFINHTSHVLEGVFYFPLPEDASISGFAMWIGDEKVEGEIVEKQRAREIYETILREKRDPGLLEWTGGNIFKARVYPISGEKRIQITYTQVLPKIGDAYRYSYALRSELTRLTPLERLEMSVTIASAQPIAAVRCPTHASRIDTGEHAARVEFSAADYTPSRDFEVYVQCAPGSTPVTTIPHLRGDDGYLMMLVDVPSDLGNLDTRSGAPEELDCIFIVDTSGSMSGPQRDTQVAFLEAFLGALGDADRFGLLTVDTQVRWAFESRQENTPASREVALGFVARRHPLGWTRLADAFGAAFERAEPSTHIIYIGDGVITSGNTDPAHFLTVMKRQHKERGTVHTVAVGSSRESLVMQGLARLGSGSSRSLGGSDADPTQAAEDLLDELTTPVLRDLDVRFNGIDVAALHPQHLPNLVASTQAVIVARFDPRSIRRRPIPTVRIRGRAGDATVEFDAAPVNLGGADQGNSFIPRLWARHHLDHLLLQGRSAQAKEQIIALSEDYQIITPFTSFLVLESDADRERFNVKKRFRMRDGEEFFAAGRDQANFELTRQQMQLARLWRKQIREQVLRSVRGMSREWTELLQPAPVSPYVQLDANGLLNAAIGGQYGALASGAVHGDRLEYKRSAKGYGSRSRLAFNAAAPGFPLAIRETRDRDAVVDDFETDARESFGDSDQSEFLQEGMDFGLEAAEALPDATLSGTESLDLKSAELVAAEEPEAVEEQVFSPAVSSPARFSRRQPMAKKIELGRVGGLVGFRDRYAGRYDYAPYSGLESLFPTTWPPQKRRVDTKWSEENQELARRLNRRTSVAALNGGLRVVTRSERLDARRRVIGDVQGEYLLSSDAWWTTPPTLEGDEVRHDWCAGGERGVVTEAWRFGRVHAKRDGDLAAWGDPFAYYFNDLSRSYAVANPAAEKQPDGTLLLTLRHGKQLEHRNELRIDPERALLLEARNLLKEELTSKTVFGGFVEAAGHWWPGEITVRDAEGRVTNRVHVTVEAMTPTAFEQRIAERLTLRTQAIVLGAPPASLAAAKQSIQDGAGRLEDHWLLLNEYAQRQIWEKAEPHLRSIGALTSSKRGSQRIHLGVRLMQRQNEEAKQLLLQMAKHLASTPRAADLYCALELYQLGSVLHGNERLQLVEALQPVHARQTRLEPLRLYDQEIFECQQLMRWNDRALASLSRLTETYPFDMNLHTNYANMLAAQGDVDSALAHLQSVQERHAPWQTYEIQGLRSSAIGILFNAWRLDDVVERLDRWQNDRPQDSALQMSAWEFNRYLTAYIMLDRVERAEKLMRSWLESSLQKELTQLDHARRDAALQHILGSGWNLWGRRFDERWADLLADVARFYVAHETHTHVAGQILANNGFKKTRQGVRLQEELYQRLQKEVDSLPLKVVADIALWLRGAGYTTDAGDVGWQEIFGALVKRWEKSGEEDRDLHVHRVIMHHGAMPLKLRYWRNRIVVAEKDVAKVYARSALFSLLLEQQWTDDIEDELLALLPQLESVLWRGAPPMPQRDASPVSPDDERTRRETDLAVKVHALYRFVSWSPRARAQARVATLPNINEMTRRELRQAHAAAVADARQETIRRLGSLQSTFVPAELRPWLRLERIGLQVQRGIASGAASDATHRDATSESLAAELWQILEALQEVDATSREAGVAQQGSDEPPDANERVRTLQRLLAGRAVATLASLSIFGNGGETLADTLLTWLDRQSDASQTLVDVREWTYELLVALDRPKPLAEALRKWFGAGDQYDQVRWGRAYGYIRAELGDVADAILIFQRLEEFDELTAVDYRTLGAWHKVQGSQEKERESLIASFKVRDEWALSNWLSAQHNRYSRTGSDIPAELDPMIPQAFIALLRKAEHPENHYWLLTNFYNVTHDFRLLECIAPAVLGQTAQKIYPFLRSTRSITQSIQDEATLDRLVQHLDQQRREARTDVDRRALSLLEFMTRYRALEQRSGIENHVRGVLKALEDAQRGEWETGEPRMMAELLATLGWLRVESVRDAVLQQLEELHTRAQRGSLERFQIAFYRAGMLASNGSPKKAVHVGANALQDIRTTNGGRIPEGVQDRLETHANHLRTVGRYRDAEDLWLGEQQLRYNTQRGLWIRERLFFHYAQALATEAELSLGRGQALYRAVEKRFDAVLALRTNESHANNLVQQRAAIWRDAHFNRKYVDVDRDVIDFAFTKLPGILDSYQYRNGQNMVAIVAEELHKIVTPVEAVRFLVGRAENEPRWLQWQSQDFWARHASKLARTFHEATHGVTSAATSGRHVTGRPNAELQLRVLAIVTRELRQDLRTQTSRSREMYHDDYSYFWAAKSDDFARVTQEVLDEYNDSEGVIRHCAEYLYSGLDRADAAITALHDAYKRDVLSLDGRLQLCQYMQRQKRFKGTIAILRPMIRERPNELEYRRMLMRAYFYTGDGRRLAQTQRAADKHFHANNLWAENVIAGLAEVCLETELFDACNRYYAEAITLHTRSRVDRGNGDGVLAEYYRNQAGALSGLGRTAAAVDAAAGAIVAWGRSQDERAKALQRLERVLRDASDLDAYVSQLNDEVHESGLENPIVRKALGNAYLELERYTDAILQLRMAVDARPEDLEAQHKLVDAYDRAGRPALASAALLTAAQTAGHDIQLYRRLGDRWHKAGRGDKAERAYTSIVESQPNESAGHQLLAEVRETQSRWEDAEHHWREVIRIRINEPTGYINLARVLIESGQPASARDIIRELRSRTWAPRFNADEQIRQLEQRLSNRSENTKTSGS